MANTLDAAREALRIFSARGARFLGAAVAFYALMSAAPLFVLVLHVVGAVFGKPRAESALWSGLGAWLTPDGVATVRGLTERLESLEASGSVLGGALVVYGSTRLFRALRRAMNQLWGIDLEAIEEARSKPKKYAIRYGGALALAFLCAVLVALLIVVKGAFALGGVGGLWAIDTALSLGFAYLLFTALFRFLPETDVSWREAGRSGAVSTVLFAAGSVVVSLWLRHKHVADLYAGASAVVLAVVWVYYSAQVFFLGACFGAAMRAREGREPAPK